VSRSLQGQRILLTGGGSGIGRAVALAYAHHGATVTVVERSSDNARELRAAGVPGLEVLVGDATDPSLLADAVNRAAGEGGLDNLTCCVGVFDNYARLCSLTAAELAAAAEEIYRVNVLAGLSAIHAALPELQRARGSVTLTLSESAFHPVGGGVLYGSSKWALRGVVSHLAVDLAPDIRVNAVAPGGTTGTRFGGLRALGQVQTADQVEGRDQRIAAGTLLADTSRPEDHAGAYVYLADRVAARMTTAAVINTDGGRRP
jgi:NAD(P)-dependent dehydrogenase (short-subunit alcohol dehydrogenase family)